MMNVPHKVKKVSSISVRQFHDHDQAALKMRLIGSDVGMDRKIQEPSTNRPGLALADFFDYFAFKRIQVLGNSELSYVDKLDGPTRRVRFEKLCATEIPCLVVARERQVPRRERRRELHRERRRELLQRLPHRELLRQPRERLLPLWRT